MKNINIWMLFINIGLKSLSLFDKLIVIFISDKCKEKS